MHKSTEERLQIIRRILLEQNIISAKELLKRMNNENLKGVSQRNLIEDIKKLRIGAINKPLNIVFERGSYKLSKSADWSFNDLNDEQQSGSDLVMAFLHKLPLGFSQLVAQTLENEFLVDNSISKGIEFKNGFPFLSNILNSRLLKVLDAFKNNKLLTFYYGKVNDPRTNEYSKVITLTPLKLVFWNNRAYLFGIPNNEELTIENVKNYAIDSISSKIELKVGPKKYSWATAYDQLDLNNYLNDCIGVWHPKNEQPKKVRRWLKDWAASYMKANPLHPSQVILGTRNQETEVQFQWTVYVTPELHFELAKFREFIKSC